VLDTAALNVLQSDVYQYSRTSQDKAATMPRTSHDLANHSESFQTTSPSEGQEHTPIKIRPVTTQADGSHTSG